jgi:hypothetical protein
MTTHKVGTNDQAAADEGAAAMPEVVDRDVWQRQIDALRIIEKAHTREGDAIAAARRRLPMVEVDAAAPLIGANGRVTLLDAFDQRSDSLAESRACAASARLPKTPDSRNGVAASQKPALSTFSLVKIRALL